MNGRSKRAQQRIDKITKYARKDREATRHDKKIARNEHDTKKNNKRDLQRTHDMRSKQHTIPTTAWKGKEQKLELSVFLSQSWYTPGLGCIIVFTAPDFPRVS